MILQKGFLLWPLFCFSVATPLNIFAQTSVPGEDTFMNTTKTGVQNIVKAEVDTTTQSNLDTLFTRINGEINQTGNNNEIKIDFSNTNGQTLDSARNQTVTIKQTGYGNSVQINQK